MNVPNKNLLLLLNTVRQGRHVRINLGDVTWWKGERKLNFIMNNMKLIRDINS